MAVYFLHLPLSSSRPPFLFSFPLLRLLIQLSLQPSSCALPVATYLSLPLKKKKINVNMRWVWTLNTKGSNVFFFFFVQATKPNIDRTAQESLNYFFCETVNQRSLSTALNLKNKQTRTPRKKKWNNRSNEKQQGGSSREVGSYRIRTQYLFSTPKLVDDFRELSQVSM